MLIDWRAMLRRQNVAVTGVLHVGCHAAEEADLYGSVPVTWIEGDADLIPAIETKLRSYPNQRVIEAMVSNREGQATFHLASNHQSSSLLRFGTHATEHPEVVMVGERTVTTTTIDALAREHRIRGNAWVADLQGSEALMLAGGERFLTQCDLVYLEVSTRPVYIGTALLPDLMQWMTARGFELREMVMTRHGWGDAVWVRVP